MPRIRHLIEHLELAYEIALQERMDAVATTLALVLTRVNDNKTQSRAKTASTLRPQSKKYGGSRLDPRG